MSPLAFFEWLAETPWSIDLHESQFAYPIIESIHVWALCLFFGSVVMFDLRLLGWIMPRVPVSEVLGRLLPWTIAGFIVMVISGTLLWFAIPLRTSNRQGTVCRSKSLPLEARRRGLGSACR